MNPSPSCWPILHVEDYLLTRSFFIVSHGLLTATRLDPIMSPGDISGHVHAIVGGSNFGPLYDYDRSIESQCVGRRGTMNSWPSTFGW